MDKYKNLVEIDIAENRKLVISEFADGGYTIAQTMEDNNGNTIFMKGAFHVDSKENLTDIRNAIDSVVCPDPEWVDK